MNGWFVCSTKIEKSCSTEKHGRRLNVKKWNHHSQCIFGETTNWYGKPFLVGKVLQRLPTFHPWSKQNLNSTPLKRKIIVQTSFLKFLKISRFSGGHPSFEQPSEWLSWASKWCVSWVLTCTLPTWMSRWKWKDQWLGSTKWVISPTYKWGIPWGYNPLTILLLTSCDIQVVDSIWEGPVDSSIIPNRSEWLQISRFAENPKKN